MQKEKKTANFLLTCLSRSRGCLPVSKETGQAKGGQRHGQRFPCSSAAYMSRPSQADLSPLPSPPVDAALILVGKIQGPASPDPLVQLTNGKREDGVVGVADEGGVWGLLPLARLLHLLHPGTFSPLPLLPPVYFLDLNRVYIQNHTKKQIFWHALLLLLKKIVASIINQEK
jgi:hypothetical protein